MAMPPTGFHEVDRAIELGLCSKENGQKAKDIAMARACNGDGFNFHDAMQILREKGWLTGNSNTESTPGTPESESIKTPTLRQRQVKHLLAGFLLYTVFASSDTVLTLKGMGDNLSLEGNPILRTMMESFGPLPGLLIEKGLVLIIASLLTIIVSRGIHNRREWVYFLAITPMTKRWMRKKRRYWIAYLPVYASALAQGLAAASWLYLLYFLPG